MTHQENRLMIVDVSFEVLREWILGKFPHAKMKSSLPVDTTIVRVFDKSQAEPHFAYDTLSIVVSSKEFDVIHTSEQIPHFEFMLERLN